MPSSERCSESCTCNVGWFVAKLYVLGNQADPDPHLTQCSYYGDRRDGADKMVQVQNQLMPLVTDESLVGQRDGIGGHPISAPDKRRRSIVHIRIPHTPVLLPYWSTYLFE